MKIAIKLKSNKFTLFKCMKLCNKLFNNLVTIYFLQHIILYRLAQNITQHFTSCVNMEAKQQLYTLSFFLFATSQLRVCFSLLFFASLSHDSMICD
jgi:hypothetical protein